MLNYEIQREATNQKLIKFVTKCLNKAPSSYIYKLFRKKDVKVNGKWEKAEYILKLGDIVTIYIPNDKKEIFVSNIDVISSKSRCNLDILFENDDVLIVNKPAGLLSQADKSGDKSLNDIIKDYIGTKIGFTPSIANRLDRNTSGIVLVGKSYQGLNELSRILKNRLVSKYYVTIVKGKLKNEIVLEDSIIRKNNVSYISDDAKGLQCRTIVTPINIFDNFTLCDVQIFTGRTHQIRAQLANIGYSILGDVKYGANKIENGIKLPYHMLHCRKLIFSDKCSLGLSNVEIVADIPPLFNKFIGDDYGYMGNKGA